MSQIIRGRITKSAVDRLLPGQTIRDTELKGFGVRRQQEVASYFLQKKRHGRVGWYTIGIHGSPFTAETARKQAMTIFYGLNAGVDPTQQKRLETAKPLLRDVTKQFMAVCG